MKKATYGDDDEEVGKRAPKGHFVIYVGEELRRFVLHISYLKNPCFQKLLEEAAQEFGFRSPKGIVLPCDECTFQKNFRDLYFQASRVQLVSLCRSSTDFPAKFLTFRRLIGFEIKGGFGI
ncbi:hypothetical protein K7X08_009040 [Anisodus acutangulus]|uniref:Small auxin up regulated protein n=1 Tax=Anisodus acutangulus TaxID=402998 RepID=A0A9Q1N4J1_9SOLA|nr:hypothetical protein K7X08_009040 [Anisodus acutangulus]